MASSHTLLLLAFLTLFAFAHGGQKEKPGVTYDERSLIINGKRELLFSGSIHYPRSTPEMWPAILSLARHGGLNVIQTYVFWNVHEPVEGQFNFEGRYDLVKFIKTIWENGMYVTLRLGPFIQAEWNHGGFPFWMREVPNVTFRTDNEPYKHRMQKFVTMIIDKMKEEKLFASQGGPIILSQIENEYNTIQPTFKEMGANYVQWAGKMAIALDTGVPWIMCKQRDAPDPIINTCNGRHCGDTFTGPNRPNKPSLWTENWTAQFRVFGDPPSQRSAEDIAYSVARFFSKNGTLNNYYMYHGGTNFGRTASSFTTTRYYDEAPLDEFGLPREPKYGHLRDLHRALNLCKRALLWGSLSVERPTPETEIRVFEQAGTPNCAAFLANNNTRMPTTIKFRGQDFYLPSRSISILPDCKTVVYNTQTIVSQHNSRNFVRSQIANKNLHWKMYKEEIPSKFEHQGREPMELYGLTKDTTDYAWYSTSINLSGRDMPMRSDIHPVLRVASLGHGMLAFVNGEYVGGAHGSKIEKNFVLQKQIALKPGTNNILLLGTLVGLPDSGPYLERRFAGPRSVTVLGLNTGTLDLTINGWGHKVGLEGEKRGVFNESGSKKVDWVPAGVSPGLTWYKAFFDAPEGDNAVAIRMTGMGKGMIWVNGNNMGRYWMSFLSPLLQPTQSEYHIPRFFLKPTNNLLVILEEEKGVNPKDIEIVLVDRDTICSYTTEFHLPTVKSWTRDGSIVKPVVDEVKAGAHLTCPNHKKVVQVEFASYGDSYGSCGNYILGNCTSPVSKKVVEKYCLGQNSCTIPIEAEIFDKSKDKCPDVKKTLAVQVKCG